MADGARERFRSVSRFSAPGALSRARALLIELGPYVPAIPFEDWRSLAALCGTAWLAAASRRPSAAGDRVTQRRLRVLGSCPTSFAAFAGLRAGVGPVHLRGTCAALPGAEGAGTLWQVETGEDVDAGRVLIEEASDFLLSLEDSGYVYVSAEGGHLVSGAPVRAGDAVSVFGFADEVPDRNGIASSSYGRGGLLPAIRSGSELPLLVTHVVR